MKKYFLGPNAANFLANQMRNQGASTEEPVLHRGRVSGSIIPFKITGDWEQRNGESVYSCIAHEVFFDGTNYVTDQESLDFFLYSPIHLSEKPDNAVGDIIFAVLRGNNWEIIGGGGGEGGGEAVAKAMYGTLTATITSGQIAFVVVNSSEISKNILAYLPPNFSGISVKGNTPVCITPAIDHTSGVTSLYTPYQAEYMIYPVNYLASRPPWPEPTVSQTLAANGDVTLSVSPNSLGGSTTQIRTPNTNYSSSSSSVTRSFSYPTIGTVTSLPSDDDYVMSQPVLFDTFATAETCVTALVSGGTASDPSELRYDARFNLVNIPPSERLDYSLRFADTKKELTRYSDTSFLIEKSYFTARREVVIQLVYLGQYAMTPKSFGWYVEAAT